jgi:ABC-type thiamine transport system substrate-binding protein
MNSRRLAAEFLLFLLSQEGQQIVAAGGNIPLEAATVEQGRRKTGAGVVGKSARQKYGNKQRQVQ